MASNNRYAVVTGANRGLGLAVARRLVHEGFLVAAVCRQLDDAQKTVKLLGKTRSVPVQLDFAEDGEVSLQAAASHIKAWLGPAKLMILVNNAGNSHASWDEAAWLDSRVVNYDGPVAFTEGLLPTLATGASVIMVGSGLGDIALLSPKYRRLLKKATSISDLDNIASRSVSLLSTEKSWVGPYGLSKALLHRATELLANDFRFRRNGILVNAICPGWVSTDMGGEQAPISVEEGAGHILETALTHDLGVTGTFYCYCYKNYDEEHARAWEQKHGKLGADAQCAEDSQDNKCWQDSHVNKKRGVRKFVKLDSRKAKQTDSKLRVKVPSPRR